MNVNLIYWGDALEILKTLPAESVNCCVTSPPYWGLRDYGIEGQLGLESTPKEYVSKLVNIFGKVKRILKKDGTLWLNLGDSYSREGGDSIKKGRHWDGRNNNPNTGSNRYAHEIGLKPKDLVGIPWMVAFALRANGWWLRQDIIWNKPNPMPESVTDRCTKSHEYIFLLSKSQKYYFDYKAISEKSIWAETDKRSINGPTQSVRAKNSQYQCKKQGVYNKDGLRNKRSVWTVNTKPFKEAHFAVFPEELIVPCIKAGCPEGGIVIDPFIGSGTTAVVARKLNRNFVGIELNDEYIKMAEKRLQDEIGLYL